MLVELTDAEILCLHKWMWSDMQKELGDNPEPNERMEYKYRWCKERYISIWHNCFLCENADKESLYSPKCSRCLVVWPDGICYYATDSRYQRAYYANSYYLNAPISDILNLPTREFVSDRRTRISMRECDIAELKKRMEEGE